MVNHPNRNPKVRTVRGAKVRIYTADETAVGPTYGIYDQDKDGKPTFELPPLFRVGFVHPKDDQRLEANGQWGRTLADAAISYLASQRPEFSWRWARWERPATEYKGVVRSIRKPVPARPLYEHDHNTKALSEGVTLSVPEAHAGHVARLFEDLAKKARASIAAERAEDAKCSAAHRPRTFPADVYAAWDAQAEFYEAAARTLRAGGGAR